MYIFKNPKVGGEVDPHTDNTYLITTPLSTRGIWVALDDATEKNGGMWGIPGSHKKPTDFFMRRKLSESGSDVFDEEGNAISEEQTTAVVYYNTDKPKYDLSQAVPLEAP